MQSGVRIQIGVLEEITRTIQMIPVSFALFHGHEQRAFENRLQAARLSNIVQHIIGRASQRMNGNGVCSAEIEPYRRGQLILGRLELCDVDR